MLSTADIKHLQLARLHRQHRQSRLLVIKMKGFQPVAFIGNTDYHPPTTPLEYSSGLPLQPEELLLYCLIKISSPGHSINSVKGYSPEKFEQVSNAIRDVYSIHFDCVKLRNYVYRSVNNQRKGLGKFKGVLRWKYYTQYVDRIITKHQKVLINLLNRLQVSWRADTSSL